MKNIFYLNSIENVPDSVYWGKLLHPVYTYLELTKNCNCNCKFCQVENLHKFNSDMPLKLFKKIVKQLKKSKFLEIRLGGGEPLITNNLYKYLFILKKLKLKYWVCTNGILLDKTMAVLLKTTGCIGVRISIDSIDEKTHNEIRQNTKAFKAAWNAVDIALKYNLQAVVSMTIGKHNIDEVEMLAKLVNEKGVKLITHPIMPVGRGINFYSKNNNICEDKKIKNTAFKFAGEKHCVACSEMIAIDSNGNVSPCTFVKTKLSLTKNSLKDILNCSQFIKYKKPIPNSHLCKNCKYGETDCTNCKFCNLCRGGCWALEELKIDN